MGKKNIVELAMRKHRMVFFFIMVTIIFGIIALPKLNKNEFPEVTIRTGVVAVIYPGATSNEIGSVWPARWSNTCLPLLT